ncbi:MAG: 4Fe-4S binding protein [Lachnospiraceae bacterium]|nr:4Fe-4S binding protein [Lachnospiraceae bacterium]MDD3615426.1 4Fe-4S binding protein [Lachnospiraceae bacterium]
MSNSIIKHFKIPECAYSYIDLMLTDTERQILESYDPSVLFDAPSMALTLNINLAEAQNTVASAYKRGVLERSDETHYHTGSFYGRLGIFCQYENKIWHSIPSADRDMIGSWYLDSFIQMNKPRWEKGERLDSVAPLEEAIHFLEQQTDPVYVTTCDCRSIFENCKHSRETCISFSNDYNSPADRGHARKISVSEAVELVINCDKEGLIHTLEGSHGMCNCCGDCCFEYRAAKICNTIGTFPITHTIATYQKEACVKCGLCVRRCPMKAFTKEDDTIVFDSNVCIGCGICVNACPKQAITVGKRPV